MTRTSEQESPARAELEAIATAPPVHELVRLVAVSGARSSRSSDEARLAGKWFPNVVLAEPL
jgi:hypothetical protein